MNDSLHANDWLALLLYGFDLQLNPKPYKYLETFEQWDYGNRLRAHLYQLERAKFLERRGTGKLGAWSLTPHGRLAACGGIDPVQRWQRPWDRKWRLVLFDLPARAYQLRPKLWRWLRGQRFGLLQQSVWATPDPVDDGSLPLDRFKLPPRTLLVVEAHAAAPVSDADLVNSAWDFKDINGRYHNVLALATHGVELARRAETRPVELGQWLAAERNAWLEALSVDPLLPADTLPSGYLGRQAWSQRQVAYGAVAERGFVKNYQ